MQRYCVFDTSAGFCAVAWSERGITGFQLPDRDVQASRRNLLRRRAGAEQATPPEQVAALIEAVRRYFAGERIDFTAVSLDLDGQNEFFTRVYAAVRRVGWGETTTYGALGKLLGAEPQAAREVGKAMANNPVPLIIPCHRVLAAGGKLGGFSAPGGAASKARMLTLEGMRTESPPPDQRSLGL